MTNPTIMELTEAIRKNAEILGAVRERTRFIKMLSGHLTKCNYFAVTEEPCDVCAYMNDLMAELNDDI